MADFTEVSSENWFSRMGKAIGGVVAGVVIFLASFGVLWQNEGCAVKQYKTINVGKKEVVTASVEKLDPANEGKLVHLSGTPTTDERLRDPIFGVNAVGIRLVRDVEMYQWVEDEEKETRKKLGGGTETVTTYTYKQEWKSQPVDSSEFRKPDGRSNPPMPYQSDTFQAKKVALGPYQLSGSLIGQIRGGEDMSLDSFSANNLPAEMRSRVTKQGSQIYIAAANPTATAGVTAPTSENTATATIGDLRISYKLVEPAPVTFVAQQIGDSFGPYNTGHNTLEELRMGTMGSEAFFAKMEGENKVRTWIIRLIGFVMMAAGIGMVLSPLSVLADVIPLLGDLVGAGVFLVAILLALPLSLITIAAAWVFFRPLIGIPLFLVSAVVLGMLASKVLSARKERKAAVA